MGVSGLLPVLKSIIDQVHISKFEGKTIGIDASGWLYKGAYSCAMDLVLGKDTEVYLNYCVQQINLLNESNIRPIFVFDGAPLPIKLAENEQRRKKRKIYKEKALKLLENGEQTASYSFFTKAVTVTNEMSIRFIEILRKMNIEFYVAPYEADAQLAYLSKIKMIDVVISEDSDCIPYGCKTILFKWNGDGWASEMRRRNLGANEDLCFAGWSEEMLLQFCVLAGCDYCPSVSGVGIITAYKLVNENKVPVKVLAALSNHRGDAVPVNYRENFYKAMLAFRHHFVFDPREKKLTMLNPIDISEKLISEIGLSLSFLGDPSIGGEVASSIANGLIHPLTRESYALQEETLELSIISSKKRGRKNGELINSPPLASSTKLPRQSLRSLKQNVATPFDGIVHNKDRQSHCLVEVQDSPSGWAHLDSVLGASPHILNFKSPHVSESFRSLVGKSAVPLNPTSMTALNFDHLKHPATSSGRKRIRLESTKHKGVSKGYEGGVSCSVAARSTPHIKKLDQTSQDETSHYVQKAKVTGIELFQYSPSEKVKLSLWNGDSEFSPNLLNRASLMEEKWDRILCRETKSEKTASQDSHGREHLDFSGTLSA